MRKLFSLIIFFNFNILTIISYAQTEIPTGDVSGTWTIANSPYNINGEITIPNDSTLTIEPGVEVIFTGHYKFNVQGRLLAIGTETDTILFTINDTTGFHDLTIPDGGWGGIRFIDTPPTNDSSKIIYCKLEYGKANTGAGDYDRLGGALCAKNNKLLVSHCMFRKNTCYHTNYLKAGGAAIAIIGNSTIEFCEFRENTCPFAGALLIWGSNLYPLIRNNYFHHNKGHGIINVGSWGGSNTSPILINNIVVNNISVEDNSPAGHGIINISNGGGVTVLINNTIINNSCDLSGSALCIHLSAATPLLINNIIYGNIPTQVRLNVTNGLDFYNCLIEGGKEGFTGAAFTGDYENCIDVDPLFMSSNDFHLQDKSNCIGAAIDSIFVDGSWYYCPLTDYDGNPRPNPLGSMPDIGAYENPLALPEPTEIPAGDVSGTWTKAFSPYHINGEITIPNDSTLTIEPGVKVVFTGHYKFNVRGRLLAIGTETDTILFTISDTTGFHHLTLPDGGWHGIKIYDVAISNDSTIFEYCTFEYGKSNTGSDIINRSGGAIYSTIDKLRVSHCLFRYNKSYDTNTWVGTSGAILIVGNPIIEYCEFGWNESSWGSAMCVAGNTTGAIIRNNHFHHNIGHGTINVCVDAYPTIINNIFEYNHSYGEPSTPYGHGILHFSNNTNNNTGNAKIINNTIVNNTNVGEGGGIFVRDGNPTFINNIVYGNEPSQVNFLWASSVGFYNNLIEGGREGFTGAAFTGAYENCIDADPQFVGSDDYHLQNTSPCIGVGIDSIQIGGTWFYCPTNCFYGNVRPNPVGSMPDIGACENPNANPVGVEDELSNLPNTYSLEQNYPNPFNPSTIIRWQMPAAGLVNLRIYDVLGREITTLVNEDVSAGKHEATFDASKFSSGIYFYQLKAGDYVETKKMIYLK